MSGIVGATKELHQDLTKLPTEELLLNTVDVIRFEAVPEHNGNLQRLVERYGDNPGSCPYIKSLGEAGIKLIQRLAEAENNPDRGLTIREIMEAKKKQAQSPITSQNKYKAPDSPSLKTEPNPRNKSTQEVSQNGPLEHTQTQIHPIEIDKNIAKTAADLDIASSANTSRNNINPKIDHNPSLVFANAELKPTNNQAQLETAPIPTFETLTKANNPSESQRQVDPVDELIAERINSVIGKSFVTSSLETNNEDAEMTLDVVSDNLEDPLFEIDALLPEPDLNYSYTGVGDTVENPKILAAINTDKLVGEEVELDNQTVSEELNLVLSPDSAIDRQGSNNKTFEPILPETSISSELHIELTKYIATLDLQKSNAAETALQTLIEVLEVNQIIVENGEDVSELETNKIEHLFIELLELLNLDFRDETVKKLMQDLFSSEMITEITDKYQLSINQLNSLGTREYKPSVTSALTRLVQMIQQRLETHLKLGRYVLSAASRA
jgi:hypothetical protein